MFRQDVRQAIEKVAIEWRFDPAALLAVAEVESGGTVFATVHGAAEPLIRWEGHYFDRRLEGKTREIARTARLAHPSAGAIPNPRSQSARWRLLARAEAIDRAAARESTSWGVGQVMGAHWRLLGFLNVDALVAEARAGAGGQARLMSRFIVASSLRDAIAREDWTSFARVYNGPGFAKNAYDKKIAAAFTRFCKSAALRSSIRGERVRRLQTALLARGYTLAADGVFGTKTKAAVSAFQSSAGLMADGIAGQKTFAALQPSRAIDHRAPD